MQFLNVTPRLFLSYARRESALAVQVSGLLKDRGFEVFLDQSAIQGGDNFVTAITSRLESADAVIALLSADACRSAWCQAELHHAHAIHKRIIPIFWPDSVDSLNDPLKRLLGNIQRAVVHASDAPSVVGGIADQLLAVRKRRRRALALRAIAGVLVLIALVAAVLSGLGRINAFQTSRERDQLIAELLEARSVLPQAQMDTRAKRWFADEAMRQRLLGLANSSVADPLTQLNAALLAHAVTGQPSRPFRLLKDVRWETGIVDRAQLMDMTFVSGRLSKLTVRNTHLANVHFGSDDALTMVDVDFIQSRFFGGSVRPGNAMNVHFRGTKFYGTELDITNFSRSTIAQVTADVRGDSLITDDIALFDGGVLLSRMEPPSPGVVDLSTPEDFLVFTGVRFVNTRFDGWFNPEWFSDCEIENSLLSESLTPQLLKRGGNRITAGHR